MKTIIIPDVHNKWQIAEDIVKKEKADQVIFLGDHFDDFGDNPQIARETAIWLKSSLKKENRIHLIGNHDCRYASANKNLGCSGYSEFKDYAINDILTPHDWLQLKWFYWLDDILITHAGLSLPFAKNLSIKEIKDLLNREGARATEMMYKLGGKHWFFGCGIARYGNDAFGGLTWNDFNQEFVPVTGLKQIFGHSPQKTPTWKEKSLCLDTHLKHYVIYENAEIKICGV